MKLDIGSGPYPQEGYTSVDLFAEADIKADMGELPLPDHSVDAIWSSHALEHVHADRVPGILAEWVRVLRPGGTLTLLVPNLDYIARKWLADPTDEWSRAIIFGLGRDEGDLHRTGWNAVTLRRDLMRAGFEVGAIEVIWDHTQETLRAECVRPASPVPTELPLDHDERLTGDAVLVACPTYKGMAYCLPDYLAAYDSFVWPNRGLMLVDNTADGGTYADAMREQMAGRPKAYVRHVEPKPIGDKAPDFEATFNACWKVILDHAEFNGYQWVLSLEQDVIIPPLGLDAMLNVAQYAQAPFVTHHYPYHHGRAGLYEGLGCVLISTQLLKTALQVTYKTVPYVEAAIYEVAQRVSRVSLIDLFEVKHLDAPPDGSKFWQYGEQDATAVLIEA